jgi:hypothetical protein
METPGMYRKLLPYVKRFIFVRQGAFNRYYEGKLIAVDNETLTMQSYKKDGTGKSFGPSAWKPSPNSPWAAVTWPNWS